MPRSIVKRTTSTQAHLTQMKNQASEFTLMRITFYGELWRIIHYHYVEKILPQILLTSPDSQLGYVVKCVLEIPEDLQEYFQGFFIAPTKEVVTMDMLSTDQIEMVARPNVRSLPKKAKLMQTLNPKHKYVLHYLTLFLYVQLGIEVKQLHQVLHFRQARWLASFVQLNTELPSRTSTKIE